MILAIACAILLQTPDVRFGPAVPDERLNRMFESREGWIGGDGAFSVPAGAKGSWWLFSDTWIGKVVDGARRDAVMVNNTAARMEGGKVTFIVRKSKDGKAMALITPSSAPSASRSNKNQRQKPLRSLFPGSASVHASIFGGSRPPFTRSEDAHPNPLGAGSDLGEVLLTSPGEIDTPIANGPRRDLEEVLDPSPGSKTPGRRDPKPRPRQGSQNAPAPSWFWLGPGALIDGKLHVLLTQLVKTDAGGAFGFRPIGLWLGVCKNPTLDPESWSFEQRQIPFARFEAGREVSFCFCLCRAGSWMYVYGTDEDVLPSGKRRFLIVARCPAGKLADAKTWRFWTGKGWSADPQTAARTVDHMASDGSVSYLPGLKRYVLVYTEDGISPRILARTSRAPEGPWSAPTEIYSCPEGVIKGVFCYAARNHPELARGNELVVSYCTNTFELSQVLGDARLYVPRFIRVGVKALSRVRASERALAGRET